MRDINIQLITNSLIEITNAIPKMQAGVDSNIPENRKEALKRLMIFSLLDATVGAFLPPWLVFSSR